MYACGGAGLLGALALCCWMLNSANGLHKKESIRRRMIAMGQDPDAPHLDP